MKMKKFFAMAFAALAIVSCSKNIDDNVNPGAGAEIGAPTYATFKFNIGSSTRAAAEFDPTASAENDAADGVIGKVQLLIFNSTSKALEHNLKVDASTATVLMSAGKKKIFFVANAENLTDYLAAIDPATFDKSKTLDDFYALNFSAGSPQAVDVDKTGARTFDFSKLYTHSNTTVGSEAGLPMTNTNEITYTLVAGVTAADAAAGTASTDGESVNNKFNIKLYYMTAKARLHLAAGVLSDGDVATQKPVIKDVKYSVRNLARVTNYIQHFAVKGQPQSYYYSSVFADAAAYNAQFDNASTINAVATESTVDYLYVPENNGALMTRGQSSYFAIEASYEPVVIKAVNYDINTKVKYVYDALATADAATKSYIYTTTDIQGIPSGSYFLNRALLEEAAWMMQNGLPFVDADHREEAKLLVLDTYFQQFTGAKSYYRVDIGSGVGADTEYGVLRSNKYDAKVNKITGPGMTSEKEINENPENPVSSKTYIEATILPAEWAAVNQSADL